MPVAMVGNIAAGRLVIGADTQACLRREDVFAAAIADPSTSIAGPSFARMSSASTALWPAIP
jgi:hypothetical protein